jgi:hypothetical protein
MSKNNATALESSHVKRRKIESGSVSSQSGQPIVLEPEHLTAYDGKKMVVQETMSPSPNTLALSQTAPFSFIWENDSVGTVDDIVLRFQLQVATASEPILPVPLWFSRIEFFDRHTGREIGRYYGDVLYWILFTLAKDLLEIIAPVVNFDPVSGGSSSNVQPVGAGYIRNYYLPFPALWLNKLGLDLSILKGDLEIKFYPVGDIRVGNSTGALAGYTGAAANFLLNEIRIVSASQMMSNLARLQFREFKMSRTIQQNYFDVQQFNDTGRVLAAASSYKVDLDQFQHNSGFLMFVLRATSSTGSNAVMFQSLGPRGTIDHENVHGRSMLGDGTAVDEKYARTFINSDFFPSDFVHKNAIEIIPFSHHMPGVVHGVIDGFQEFVGAREGIRFVTDSALVESSYLMGFTVGALGITGGRLQYRGCDITLSTLDISTITFAQLNKLINSCPTVIEDNLWFTLSASVGGPAPGTPDAAPAVEWLVQVRHRGTGQPVDLSVIPAQLDYAHYFPGVNGAVQNVGYASVTNGTPGFRAGTYDITVYSLYYRHLQEAAGRLEIEQV